MHIFRILLVVLAGLVLTACDSKFQTYNGPAVNMIEVHKSERKMYMLHDGQVVKTYDINLGGNPIGHKQFEGDGKTPEGQYVIDRKNPNSQFHLSVGISYPNAADRRAAGTRSPGGDIFIHGTPRSYRFFFKDWTWGCVAVSNREIEEIYAMVDIGTPIWIYP